jgi:hypothetical protein
MNLLFKILFFSLYYLLFRPVDTKVVNEPSVLVADHPVVRSSSSSILRPRQFSSSSWNSPVVIPRVLDLPSPLIFHHKMPSGINIVEDELIEH